jgi:hypothetical protein
MPKRGNKKGKICVVKVPRHCPLVLLVSLSRSRRRLAPEIENSFYWAHLSRFYLKTEIEYSLRNVVFLNKRQDDG